MILFKSRKKKKLEEKFNKMHQTTDRKEAMDYIYYKKQGLLSELKEKVSGYLIKDFQMMGYIIIQRGCYCSK